MRMRIVRISIIADYRPKNQTINEKRNTAPLIINYCDYRHKKSIIFFLKGYIFLKIYNI